MAGHRLAGLVGLPDADLNSLIAGLARAQITVACAESLTGGLLTALLTEVPGASAVVRGGVIVYATELKHSLAGVDSVLLSQRGPVDPDVAIALARGVRTVCGAQIGVGLTGVAGPDPQHGVAVGTWYVAVAGEDFDRLVTHLPDETTASQRSQESLRDLLRHAAVRAAVGLLADLVVPE